MSVACVWIRNVHVTNSIIFTGRACTPLADCYVFQDADTLLATGAALHENSEVSAKLTTANGGTFTSSSARLSNQSHYSTLDR